MFQLQKSRVHHPPEEKSRQASPQGEAAAGRETRHGK